MWSNGQIYTLNGQAWVQILALRLPAIRIPTNGLTSRSLSLVTVKCRWQEPLRGRPSMKGDSLCWKGCGVGVSAPICPSAFPTLACSLPRILTRNERWRKVKETKGKGETSTVSKRAHMKWRMGAALTHIMPFGFLLFLFNWRFPFRFFLFNFFNFTFSHSETFIIFTLTKIRIVLRILTWNRRLHTSSLKSSKKWGF